MLCLAGFLASIHELSLLFSGVSSRSLFGVVLEGGVAWALTLGTAIFYATTALGLWRGRAWARYAALGLMVALLAALMLVWSPGGYGAGAARGAILWQISAFPFLTFTIMYLWLGDRWFE